MIDWSKWNRVDALVQSAVFGLFWAVMMVMQGLIIAKLHSNVSTIRTELQAVEARAALDREQMKDMIGDIRMFINEHAGTVAARKQMEEAGL